MDSDFKKQVLDWAEQEDLLKPENIGITSMKLAMTCKDINNSILSGKKEEQIDAIGEAHVFLVVLCSKLGIDYEDTIASALGLVAKP